MHGYMYHSLVKLGSSRDESSACVRWLRMNEGANIAMVTEEQKQVNTLQYCGSDTDENGILCPSTDVIRLACLAA